MNLNIQHESFRAILVFFKLGNTVDLTYGYPLLKDIKIDIDGVTNQLFTSEYLPMYSYEDAKIFDNFVMSLGLRRKSTL